MIVQPEEMSFSEKTFSMIIYGAPGTGKTTLALSAPDPVIIDFDRGMSRVKAQHRKTAIFCSSYEEVLKDIESPVVDAKKTVIIDTGGSFVSFLQDWAMRSNPANRQKNGQISQKGFGAVKAEFNRFTAYVRDVKGKNLIYVFHSEEKMDRDGNPQQRLMCEGSSKNTVWTPCDFGGYVQMIGDQRYICFTPEQEYFAKGCHGISGKRKIPALTDTTKNDFISRLFEEAKASITAETELFAPQKAVYDEAMNVAKAAIEAVTDVDSANAAFATISTLEHALTSKAESWAMLTAECGKHGIVFSKAEGKFVEAAVRANA